MKNDVVILEFSQHIEIEERWVDDDGGHHFSSVDVYHEDLVDLILILTNIKEGIDCEKRGVQKVCEPGVQEEG